MKKFLYISLFGFLGFLISFIVHVIIEIPIIYIAISNFDKYTFGLSWDQILLIHTIFTVILSLGGITMGIWMGFKGWKYIYVDKKYNGRWFKIK